MGRGTEKGPWGSSWLVVALPPHNTVRARKHNQDLLLPCSPEHAALAHTSTDTMPHRSVHHGCLRGVTHAAAQARSGGTHTHSTEPVCKSADALHARMGQYLQGMQQELFVACCLFWQPLLALASGRSIHSPNSVQLMPPSTWVLYLPCSS